METDSELSTTATSFEVVLALQRLDGATPAELSAHLDIPKSTLHRHLETLADYGLVGAEDGRYHVGLRFLELGEHSRSRTEAHRLAESSVRDLARKTGECAQYVVEERGNGVCLHVHTGDRAVQTGFEVGHRIELHSTAAGKVVLAHLPDERVGEVIEANGLPAVTSRTVTDRDQLLEELAEIEERGYAFDDEEHIDGLRAVAGPVTTDGGDLRGVLSVSGPANRLKGSWFRTTIPDLVLGSANELELRIEYA